MHAYTLLYIRGTGIQILVCYLMVLLSLLLFYFSVSAKFSVLLLCYFYFVFLLWLLFLLCFYSCSVFISSIYICKENYRERARNMWIFVLNVLGCVFFLLFVHFIRYVHIERASNERMRSWIVIINHLKTLGLAFEGSATAYSVHTLTYSIKISIYNTHKHTVRIFANIKMEVITSLSLDTAKKHTAYAVNAGKWGNKAKLTTIMTITKIQRAKSFHGLL